MAKYHITAKGEPGPCRAKEGNCPLADSNEHYDSLEEARGAFEAAQSTFTPSRSKRLTKTYDELEERWGKTGLKDYSQLPKEEQAVLDRGLDQRANQRHPGYKKYGVMHRQTNLLSYSPTTKWEWYKARLVFDHVNGKIYGIEEVERSAKGLSFDPGTATLARVTDFGADADRAISVMNERAKALDENFEQVASAAKANYVAKEKNPDFQQLDRVDEKTTDPFSAHRDVVLNQLRAGVQEKDDEDQWLREHGDANEAREELATRGFNVDSDENQLKLF